MNNVATKDFNGVSLFDGASLNVTTDSDANTFTMTGVALTGTTFTNLSADSVGTTAGAITALADVKTAITALAADRANIGANMEALTNYSNQLGTLNTNLAAANSQIMDVDIAQESSQYAKFNILVQSGTAKKTQTNTQPQTEHKLLS